MQVLKPIEISLLTVIMFIGIISLSVELIEYEEIAKLVVIPSLVLLLAVTGYSISKTIRLDTGRFRVGH